MGVSIVGWAHARFGKFDELDLESLITSVAREAIHHAAISPERVDGIWLGNLNGGFVPDVFCSSLTLQADDALRWKPAVRVENACASGSAAIYGAIDAIRAGAAKIALVVGAEKMSSVTGKEATRILGNCSYVKEESTIDHGFAGIFGRIAEAYFERYGDVRASLARIAAKNHANGTLNPWAHMRKDLGFEFCNTVSDKNPLIAGPLRKTDCSLVSDGAAALVLADDTLLAEFARAVGFRGTAHVNDYLPMSRRDPVAFEGPRRAWALALQRAGAALGDLSFAEVHDCFTIAELLSYEAMGLASPGKGATVIDEDIVARDGALPVNVSGGLKAKGHPIGATGVSMHVLSAMQLCGDALDMQLANVELAGVFNMGGSAVANYVSILERRK
ncbi:acetyl-CoA acetyltransferase [Trinickia diaoshuihuensis]|uniref:acetyl-CoA acetyltransferase n=1 Tax=Trinickia diaoshuihuensis TaxID=2292265 RepID=UPI000E236EDB|nr:acetyl-CoA acetyltransferase [Trinickia diaoshuihuensis]